MDTHGTLTALESGWLEYAISLGSQSVSAGGGPFGALVTRGTVVLGTGTNRVVSSRDPTAHAEVLAIRAACRSIDDFRLTGCTLVSSCEPCPMCITAALWARLQRVVYAADREDAGAAGFDDSVLYDVLVKPRPQWSIAVAQWRVPSSLQPFEAWLSKADRVEY